jgi:hypothetical protein
MTSRAANSAAEHANLQAITSAITTEHLRGWEGGPITRSWTFEPQNDSLKRTAGTCIVKWENAYEAWG